MTLQDICVSLELAKQLKEAGFPQESLFYWVYPGTWWGDGDEPLLFERGHFFRSSTFVVGKDCGIPAPTVAELGEALPAYLDNNNTPTLTLDKGDGWDCCYKDRKQHHLVGAEKMSDVLAKMWLYLKKEGLLGGKK